MNSPENGRVWYTSYSLSDWLWVDVLLSKPAVICVYLNQIHCKNFKILQLYEFYLKKLDKQTAAYNVANVTHLNYKISNCI